MSPMPKITLGVTFQNIEPSTIAELYILASKSKNVIVKPCRILEASPNLPFIANDTNLAPILTSFAHGTIWQEPDPERSTCACRGFGLKLAPSLKKIGTLSSILAV